MGRTAAPCFVIAAATLLGACGEGGPVSPEAGFTREASLQVNQIELSELRELAVAEGRTVTPLRVLCVTDPRGDHTGGIDVSRMVMVFDQRTGDYRIWLTAYPADPFLGAFRVNINLFNPSTGTTVQDPAFFSDASNDFNLPSPMLRLGLTGNNARLLQWGVGDLVFTNSLAGTGNPDGVSLFRTAVVGFPLAPLGENEDFIAFEDTSRPARVRALTTESLTRCS